MRAKYYWWYGLFSVSAGLCLLGVVCSVLFVEEISRFALAISFGLLGFSALNCRHLLKKPPAVDSVAYTVEVGEGEQIPRIIRFVLFNKGDYPTLVQPSRAYMTDSQGQPLDRGDVWISLEEGQSKILKGHEHIEIASAAGVREDFTIQYPVRVVLEFVYFCEGKDSLHKAKIVIRRKGRA